MYSVSQGQRLDLSERSLSMDIPHRGLIIRLMESGWAQNPDERPSFLSEFTLPDLCWTWYLQSKIIVVKGKC